MKLTTCQQIKYIVFLSVINKIYNKKRTLEVLFIYYSPALVPHLEQNGPVNGVPHLVQYPLAAG